MTSNVWNQRVLQLLAAGIVLLTLASAALAADPDEDVWTFRAAPYFWATSLDGDVATISGIPAADVDASFSDIWDNLNLAAMGTVEARHARFGITADLLYFKISADGNGPTAAFSKAELDLSAFVGTFGGFYQFVQEESLTADVMVGARVWVTDTKLSLRSGLVPGRSDSDMKAWADPIFAVRGFVEVIDKIGLRGYGDIGGFGLASDITYQLLGSVSYAFTDTIAVDAGYRYLKVDYDDGDYLLDAVFQGPFLGFVIDF